MNTANEEQRCKISAEIELQKRFKSSSRWYKKCTNRKKLYSYKQSGEAAFMDQSILYSTRNNLRKKIFMSDIQGIGNTEGAGEIFRALTRRSINTRDQATGNKLVKDRLTAVMNVFEDGKKGILVVIGP